MFLFTMLVVESNLILDYYLSTNDYKIIYPAPNGNSNHVEEYFSIISGLSKPKDMVDCRLL